MLSRPATYVKAIVAALGAAASAFVTAIDDGALTMPNDILIILSAAVVTFAAVYKATNAPDGFPPAAE